jgi:hypothetical protein
MIRLDVAQGSPEWFAARIGIPTASNFDKIITPTGKPSGQMAGYAHRLIAEQMMGVSLDEATGDFLQRGTGMEDKARAYYELRRGTDVEQVGFILRDDRRVGCSPDGLVAADGMVEIKVPAAHTHVGYLLDAGGIGYKHQTQGGLWLAGREWIDTISYHDTMPSALVRVWRDEEYIKTLARLVDQFLSFVDESKEKLMKRGYMKAEEFPPLRVVA